MVAKDGCHVGGSIPPSCREWADAIAQLEDPSRWRIVGITISPIPNTNSLELHDSQWLQVSLSFVPHERLLASAFSSSPLHCGLCHLDADLPHPPSL